MVVTDEHSDDRTSELIAFDNTQAGVKGLVDAGITKVPRIFYTPQDAYSKDPEKNQFSIPVIDLDGIGKDPIQRREIVEKIRDASEVWGFFQVVNHGIPQSVLEEMLNGVRRFYEQDTKVKKRWYTRDSSKRVVHNSNFDLFKSASANWRDTTYCSMAPQPPSADELPEACRDILIEYAEQVKKLGRSLFELVSEALGLNPSYLNDIGCSEGLAVLYHYYPACPEPELTLGTGKHSDSDFLTVLLQDHIGGLQVLHNNYWVHIPPVSGALVVNVGELLQLISNDKFKSIAHRVLASHVGPRVSVACFFTTGHSLSSRVYGPIKELLSEDNPARYRETSVKDFSVHYDATGIGGKSALSDFRI
ncbi:1-aminocyclopropane-1-carboxylate oxidase homolog 1-like [Solanum dulcamara]|uniref:1-aminocyclopropane-1-carboxylate oxidase homolog 1-like n=1 Tax=Solanum dulcamara TaxID=45834 RepID=UPI002485D8FF|nr:1-aminocyclopropane-1-carboxylate oxidase homolog 1-like [Solanum dulcamara]